MASALRNTTYREPETSQPPRLRRQSVIMALEEGPDAKPPAVSTSTSVAGNCTADGHGGDAGVEENGGSDSVGWHSRERFGENGGIQGLGVRPTLYHVRFIANASAAECNHAQVERWGTTPLIADSTVYCKRVTNQICRGEAQIYCCAHGAVFLSLLSLFFVVGCAL